MAEVAISVAMVMPLTGEAELPTMPTMRAETVTKRKPKTTTSNEAAMLANTPDLGSGNGMKLQKEEHQHDQND